MLVDGELSARSIFQEFEVRYDSNALTGSIDTRRARSASDDDRLANDAERLRSAGKLHRHGLSSEWRDVAIDLRFADLVQRLLEDLTLLHFINNGEDAEADSSAGDDFHRGGDRRGIGEIRTE